jgi:hypothetical protein
MDMNKVVHLLKCHENYLKRLVLGHKTAEVRYNDRDYQLGDIICFSLTSGLQELLDIEADRVDYEITHIHSGLGLQEGYVMLSLGKPRFWTSMDNVE